jgi:hypothetical protein
MICFFTHTSTHSFSTSNLSSACLHFNNKTVGTICRSVFRYLSHTLTGELLLHHIHMWWNTKNLPSKSGFTAWSVHLKYVVIKAVQKQVSKELAHFLVPSTNFYHYCSDAINETTGLCHFCCMSMPGTQTQKEHRIPVTAPNRMHMFLKIL